MGKSQNYYAKKKKQAKKEASFIYFIEFSKHAN